MRDKFGLWIMQAAVLAKSGINRRTSPRLSQLYVIRHLPGREDIIF